MSVLKLRSSSPAPTSRIKESDTSAMVNAVRQRTWDVPPVPRAAVLRASTGFTCEACHAGAIPKIRAVVNAIAAATAKTRQSIPAFSMRGISGGAMAVRASISSRPVTIPATHPAAAITRLSVIS